MAQPSSSGAVITIERITAQQPGRLRLACPAIGPDGAIDAVYSGYGDNLSPPLEWTVMPEAETIALIVEDPDAPMDRPVLHWAIWNIPGTISALPQGIGPGLLLHDLGGAVQGANTQGQHGYMGPRPPADDGPHHYHFQLFTLDLTLDLSPNTPLEELVKVLKAHAIASAELVGTFEHRTDLAAPEPRTFAGEADRGGLDEDDLDLHAPHDADGVVRPGA